MNAADESVDLGQVRDYADAWRTPSRPSAATPHPEKADRRDTISRVAASVSRCRYGRLSQTATRPGFGVLDVLWICAIRHVAPLRPGAQLPSIRSAAASILQW